MLHKAELASYANCLIQNSLKRDLICFLVLFVIFYVSAYFSVSPNLPSSIPVHHDDYSNYAFGGNRFVWTWSRPLSSYTIYLLAHFGPDWLIWSVRLLTVLFVFLTWRLVTVFYAPKYFWLLLILFGTACFSSPVIVEYARYTGMITHLTSGCLGLFAVICLFRAINQANQKYLIISVIFLWLSTLAKEDFILLYTFSLAYIFVFHPTNRKIIILFAMFGLFVSILIIGSAKFFSTTQFLGVTDNTSSYFIDISIGSVIHTIFRYLTGAGHPTIVIHGLLITGLLLFASLVFIFTLVQYKTISKSGYFIFASLSIMAPYSVLPNHVNPYYEIIWLPLMLSAIFFAIIEFTTIIVRNVNERVKVFAELALILGVVIVIVCSDYHGRLSVAAWYDNIANVNAKTINYLYAKKAQINQVENVCIEGADLFSPWYMHNGSYLSNVMGINATWYILLDTYSPFYTGMLVGANASNNRVNIIPISEKLPASCFYINLAKI